MGRHCFWSPRHVFVSFEFERKYLLERYGEDSWRVKVVRFVHSHRVQILLMALLALDVLALVTELILDAEFPACSRTLNFCEAGTPPEEPVGSGGQHRALLREEGTCEAYCLEHPHWVHSMHTALFIVTLVVLAVFEVELVALLVATKTLFFRNAFYLFDFVIVTTALCLEAVLHTVNSEQQDLGGLLILVRLWRLLRLGHAIGTDVHEVEHHKIEKLHKELADLRRQVAALQEEGKGGQPASAHQAASYARSDEQPGPDGSGHGPPGQGQELAQT